MEIQGLGQVALHCQDLEQAVSFYRDVLSLPFLFSAPPALAFFQVGAVRLMVSVSPEPTPGSILYFKVSDCAAATEDVRAHAFIETEPHLVAKMPDHELWMAFFRDPDQNLLAFMEERREVAG